MSPSPAFNFRAMVVAASAISFVYAAPSEARIEALFRPFLAERITLSPDGSHIAYTLHTGTDLALKILDVDNPSATTTVIVEEDRLLDNSTERQRATLRFLRWASPDRLVFAPQVHRIAPAVRLTPVVSAGGYIPPRTQPQPTIIAPLMAIDADGGNARTLVDAQDFQVLVGGTGGGAPGVLGRVPHIIGFAPGDRDHLLIHVNRAGSDPAQVMRLNVHSGRTTQVTSDIIRGTKMFDHDGQPRLLIESGSNLRRTFRHRAPDSSRWSELHTLAKSSDAAHFVDTPETYFGERATPLGFDFDSNTLIYASNVGRDTFGVYGLDMATLDRTTLAVEHPGRDLAPLDASTTSNNLIFDEARQTLAGIRADGAPPFTIWIDPELAQAQQAFDAQFPRRSVTILEWNDARSRFLLRVTGGTEPGRYYLFKRDEGSLAELFRSAPWLASPDLHDTRFIEFDGPEGSRLSGYLTLPRTPRVTPIPLVIGFAEGLPAEPHAEFDREAHVLADLGLAVLRLNQRGVVGRGRKQRESFVEGLDHAGAADAKAAIEWISKQHPIDRKRVVAMGNEFGGYLALRAAQLEPALFRCVFVTEPVIEPATLTQAPVDFDARPPTFSQEANRLYLERVAGKGHKIGVMSSGADLVQPTFIVYRSYLANATTQGVARLRAHLKRNDIPHRTLEVREDYGNGMPKARAAAYRELEEFLNLNLYHYDVKLGPTREIR